MLKNTCQNCQYRQIGCHSKCNAYKEYKEKIDKIKKNRRDFNTKMGLTLSSYRKLYI